MILKLRVINRKAIRAATGSEILPWIINILLGILIIAIIVFVAGVIFFFFLLNPDSPLFTIRDYEIVVILIFVWYFFSRQ